VEPRIRTRSSPDATWQDEEDHFRVAGEVVFASGGNRQTGESKCCGVVQYRND
jgi:hypothetical protein